VDVYHDWLFRPSNLHHLSEKPVRCFDVFNLLDTLPVRPCAKAWISCPRFLLERRQQVNHEDILWRAPGMRRFGIPDVLIAQSLVVELSDYDIDIRNHVSGPRLSIHGDSEKLAPAQAAFNDLVGLQIPHKAAFS
jgi:hypothetical protein